jgi:hypothetical protein
MVASSSPYLYSLNWPPVEELEISEKFFEVAEEHSEWSSV